MTNGSSGEWSCTEASLDVAGTFYGKKIEEMFDYNCSDILMGPTQYSYSCSTVKLKGDNNSAISFKWFQVRNSYLKFILL